MRTRIIFFVLICCFPFSIDAQTADQRVEELMEKNEWFLLDEEFPVLKNKISSPVLKKYTEMMLKVYFNELPAAMKDVESLLANHQDELGNKLIDVVICECQVLARMGYYEDAADRMRELTNQLAQFVPKENIVDLFTFVDYYNQLRHVKPFYILRSGKEVKIPFTLEKVGRGNLMFFMVNIHGQEYKFFFDTGTTGMVLSERMAEKIGLKPIADSPVTGSMGKKIGKIATIDSIQIGEISYYNPLVHIIPPDPAVDSIFQIDAALGADFMNLIGELHIYPAEKKIVFPARQMELPPTGRNMMVSNGAYYLKVFSGNERFKMLFDSGNVESDLFASYYRRHQYEIISRGIRDSIYIGGVGGYAQRQVIRLDSISLKIGDIVFSLNNVAVNPDKEVYQNDEDGALGMTFICSFSKVIINFRKMFLKVE